MIKHTADSTLSRSEKKRVQQTWVGLLVLLGVGTGLLLVLVMTDPGMFRGRFSVYTYVRDAGGVRYGDPVQLRGVNVGRVSGFVIDRQRARVRVELEFHRGRYRVPRDSTVEIRSRSIYGEMAAFVIPGTSEQDVRPGEVLEGRLVTDIFSGGPEIAQGAEEAVSRVNTLLSDRTIENLEASAVELRALLQQLGGAVSEQRDDLRALTTSLRNSAEQLESLSKSAEVKVALRRSATAMAGLEEASRTLDRTTRSLELVLNRLERGEGSLGKLLTDDTLYENLNQALQNTSELAADIRARPGRYVRLSLF